MDYITELSKANDTCKDLLSTAANAHDRGDRERALSICALTIAKALVLANEIKLHEILIAYTTMRRNASQPRTVLLGMSALIGLVAGFELMAYRGQR